MNATKTILAFLGVFVFGLTPLISQAGEQKARGPSYELSALIRKDVVNKQCEVNGYLGLYAAAEGKITSATLTHLTGLDCQVAGTISDFVISDDRVSYVILGHGGFMRLAEKPVAVPITALTREPMGRPFVLDVRSERMASAPLYRETRLSDRAWAEDVYRYFGQQPSWTEGAKQFSDMIWATVSDSTGKEIGYIRDLVMDSKGRISFAVFSYGGDWESGETGKMIALPYGALSPKEVPQRCVLNVSPEKMTYAPSFDRSLLDNQKWVENTYRYFGIQPYWTEE